MAGNVFRTLIYVSLGGLVGYYNFQVNGVIGLATNVAFLALGILGVLSWKRAERNCCEPSSGNQSLNETATNAAAAAWPDGTDRAGMDI